ncbi:hypothetical protein HDU84_001490 [Entophlyctis sp. JEL0112]|nr:hypothetical protein HDU84_001490 [Entophlyctis sp. JEL0112]
MTHSPWLRPHPAFALVALFLQVLPMLVGGLPFQQLLILIVCDRIDSGGTNATGWLTPRGNFHSVDYDSCARRGDVQAGVASWTLWMHLAQEIPGVLVLIVAGLAVDLWGRRRAMLIANASVLVSAIVFLSAAAYSVPLSLVVAANFVSGLCGGVAVTGLAVTSYIVEHSNPLLRTRYFVLVDSAAAIGVCLGPMLGGAIARYFGFVPVFATMLAISTLLELYLLFVFPDSQASVRDAAERGTDSAMTSKTNFRAVFISSVDSCVETVSVIAKYHTAASLLAITTLGGLVMNGVQIMFFFYPSHKFGWDSFKIGQFIFLSSAQKIAWLAVLLPLLISTIHRRGLDKISSDISILRIGIFVAMISELWYASVTSEAAFLFGTVISSMSSFVSPTVRSLFSTLVSTSHQGRLFSSIKLFESIPLLFATVAANKIYASTVATFPNAIFFCMAMLQLCALLVAGFGVSRAGVLAMEMQGVVRTDSTSVADDALEAAEEVDEVLDETIALLR